MTVLADIASSLQAFVRVATGVYTLLVLVHVLLSWVPTLQLGPVRRFLDDTCEPVLRLFRRVIPSIGPLDLSPIVALIVLQMAGRLLETLIGRVL